MKFRYLSLLSAIMVTGGVCLAQTNQPAAIENFRPASTNQPGKQYPQALLMNGLPGEETCFSSLPCFLKNNFHFIDKKI